MRTPGVAALVVGTVVLMVVALRAWLAAADGSDLAPASDDTAFLILGWVAMLLAAGAPGKRSALPHARMLLHQPQPRLGVRPPHPGNEIPQVIA